jgi:hypothetical protein
MRRTFLLFGAGLAVGALAMFFADRGGGGGAAPAATRGSAGVTLTPGGERGSSAVAFLTLITGSVSTAERAALLKLAAEADAPMLEALAAQVAVLPNLTSRRLALEVLFTRYAELDPAAALAFAQSLDRPADALTSLFSAWARRDAGDALQALGELDPATALTLGVTLLEVLGNDGLGIARVLGAAPRIDADRFRIEAAVAKAATDPAEALDDILLLPPSKARASLERIAALWASGGDVHGALAAADAIADDSLRSEFKAAVMRAWAYADAEALVDYALALGAEERDEALRSGALQAFALIDPKRALEAAEGMPGQLGTMIRRAGLMSLARDDPLGAIRLAEDLPPADREAVLSAIATSYGRTDPDAALAWAQSLSPPSPGIVVNVLAVLARADPDRAIDLLFQTAPADQRRTLTAFLVNGSLDAEHTAVLANRLLAEPAHQSMLRYVSQMWAQRQPRASLPWLLANTERASPAAIAQAGVSLARTDPAAAVGYLAAMPSELRPAWISAVAEGYAQTDPRAAAAWIERHRGEAGYEAGVAAIAGRTAAAGDPAAGARLLASIDLAQAPDAPASARQVAAAWAQQDPTAAAAWARDLRHPDAVVAAVNAVANRWVERDAAAARNWTFGLPEGAARDAALVQVLGATAGTPAADPALLEAFSSAAAQQSGVHDAVRTLAQRNPDAARELADRYLTDPAMRRAAERFLEQASSGAPFAGRPPPRLPPTR